jgi:hypothetical protein
MTLNEIVDELKAQLESLEDENSKSTKVSNKRARSIANEIKKLAAEYKKISLTEEKA